MKRINLALAAAALIVAGGCSSKYADTVVYGTIRTAEADNPVAEAIAVKDGKYIYVGDKAGAAAFVKDGATAVIDHTGKGMVMPGCFEGHAHYLMANTMNLMGALSIDHGSDGVEDFFTKLKATYDEAKKAGKSSIIGFGWNYHTFLQQGMPTRQQLDEICPDIALFVNDSEGHKGLANTLCLRNAGILDADGNVLIGSVRGGKISMGKDGKPDGLLMEQASTYVRSHGINFDDVLSPEASVKGVEATQQMLLANGYISYMDGWSNFFGNTAFYDAARDLDAEGRLNVLLGLSYEIESSCSDIDGEIAKAVEVKKYGSSHIKSDYIKLFIDGTVEGGTGLTMDPYPDGHQGIANWEENEVADITSKANAKGLTMHIHTMGDGAVHRCVNAFEQGGLKEARNTLVHVRNMPEGDFKRAADNGVVAVAGILWHAVRDEFWSRLEESIPAGIALKGYPMKSFFDNGVVMASHCDFPATSGSPYDPFGIMEIALTGSVLFGDGTDRQTRPWWPEELITREQAFQALTINGAWQMHVEGERGSIKPGKWADFLLVDKDVFDCPVTDIHNAKVLSTWFEGRKVYTK